MFCHKSLNVRNKQCQSAAKLYCIVANILFVHLTLESILENGIYISIFWADKFKKFTLISTKKENFL